MPITPESFESRKALPEVWRGLRDEALCETSGIEGGVFVHASGFIGGALRPKKLAKLQSAQLINCYAGNKFKEGALKMAIRALAM